ncbi:MAG TPA: adenylyl-sulfate kinase [Roseiflexaceae bacterium]|nr:adenylyl-sulfate kinase [Roseiflexaceae bacterium]
MFSACALLSCKPYYRELKHKRSTMDTSTGWVVWLTGLPASGKTTIAWALQHKLAARGISAAVLDSDALRGVLLPNSSYAPTERDWFYNRLVELAVWLVREGEHVIIAATGSRRSYREAARARLGARFAEVWIRCPVEVCRARDPKGLYASAATGMTDSLPGVDVPYEAPEQPDAVVDTDQQTPEQAAEVVLATLPFFRDSALAEIRASPLPL